MLDGLTSPAAFQQSFGASLAGISDAWLSDAAIARALTIHRNTSARAAQDALGGNYPLVRALVGDDAFSACAAIFVEAQPPIDPRLCLFGEDFQSFLTGYLPFHELSYLPDVAALERMCTESLFAADADLFDGNDLDLDAPLLLHPATRIARFDSPTVAIWQAHQPGTAADAIEEIIWDGCTALVTRPNELTVSAIAPPTATFVEQCASGATLSAAATAAIDAGGDISSIFAELILCGAFQNPSRQGELS